MEKSILLIWFFVLLLTVILIFIILILSLTGESVILEGLRGPAGPKGPQGPKGKDSEKTGPSGYDAYAGTDNINGIITGKVEVPNQIRSKEFMQVSSNFLGLSPDYYSNGINYSTVDIQNLEIYSSGSSVPRYSIIPTYSFRQGGNPFDPDNQLAGCTQINISLNHKRYRYSQTPIMNGWRTWP